MSELYPSMECFDCFNEIPDNSQLNLLVNNTIKQICIQCSKNATYKLCIQCKHLYQNKCTKCTIGYSKCRIN